MLWKEISNAIEADDMPSSSVAMTSVRRSALAPPKSRGTIIPNSPSLAAFDNTSGENFPSHSDLNETGSISELAKSLIVC
jgi:hypothetical protein